MTTNGPVRRRAAVQPLGDSQESKSWWLTLVLTTCWIAVVGLLETRMLSSVPVTMVGQVLMLAPMMVGLGVLAVMLSRANTALAEQNARLARAERAAAGLAAELETVLDSITDILVVTDKDGHLSRVNRTLQGVISPEWVGRGGEEIHHPGGLRPLFREDGSPFGPGELPYERALAGETVENETVLFKLRDGQLSYCLASASPIRDPATGEVTGSVTLLRDVSSLKRLERLKDEFLFTVSHELRTPLAVIRGYAELSLASSEPGKCGKVSKAEARETSVLALRRILGEIDQMAALLEQMLQIARLDAGRVTINSAELDLCELTKAELNQMSSTPGFARLVLDLEEAPGPLLCGLDRVAYRQVLRNLVSNALKYSPPDSPVTIRLIDRGDRAAVSVSDLGGGIPEDELPLIFEKFYRAQNAVDSGAPGLGLGLYITGRLVELMLGQIEVDSRPGQGTTFTVSFPLRSCSAA